MVCLRKNGILGLIIISVMFSVLSTGCGKGKNIGSQNVVKVEKKSVLSFWSWASHTDYIRKVYDTAIENFNAKNEFNVEIQPMYIPGEQYKTRLQTEMAANSVPDILNVWAAGKMKPFVDNGRLYPIGDALDKDKEWKARYIDGIFRDTTFEGKIYGIPQIRSVSVLFYNKEMFENYGIKTPETWTDILEVVKAFRERGRFAFAFDGRDPWGSAMYAEYIAGRLDPEAYHKAARDGEWSSPVYIETGKKIQELAKESAFPKESIKIDYITARKLFDEERAAMYLQGNWDLGYLSTISPIKDKIGVLKFPVIEGGKGDKDSLLTGVEAVVALSSQCRNLEAATAFLKYLSEDEIAKDLLVEKGCYMSTVKVEPDPARLTGLYKEVEGIVNSSKNNFGYYDVLLGPVVGDKFNVTIQSILAGTTPEDAFRKLTGIAKARIGESAE